MLKYRINCFKNLINKSNYKTYSFDCFISLRNPRYLMIMGILCFMIKALLMNSNLYLFGGIISSLNVGSTIPISTSS